MERAIQDISCEEVVELQEQPATGTSERRTSVIEEPPQDGEAPPPVLPRDLEVRRRRIELQKKELKLENARKNLELENARKELDIELQEIELEEEISDHSSRVSAYAAKAANWLRDTNRIGVTPVARPHGNGHRNGDSGQPPLNPIATAGVMATRTAPAPLRYDDTMADDARGRQPSTPVTARFPPKYDCTWEVDQAAAQEREYMEWRRAVEDSIKVHRESKHSRPYKPEEITGANSTMESKPATQRRVLPLTPEQESARKSIPKELPAFSGDVGQWPLFYATYVRSTILCGFSDDENLIRLQRALRGPALESVDHLMLLPDGLPKVIEILRTEYGRPDLIVDSLIEKVRKLPPVRTERLETLATYGKMIRKMCATIEASGLHDYECNVTLLKELVAKLPGERVLEWARYKLKLKRETIREFDVWFSEIAQAASAASKTFDRNFTRPETSRPLPGRKAPAHVNVHSTTRRTQCALCHDSCRTLADCARFGEMTVRERRLHIQGRKLCVTCLGPHRGTCFVRTNCGTDGCRETHHKLLHCREQTPQSHRNTQHTHSLNSHISNDTKSLFRYVPVVVRGQKTEITTFAFIDEGSSATFVDRRLIDELGIEGTLNPLCLKWTDDTLRNESDSREVQLRISGVHQGALVYDLRKAHTLQDLMLPVQTLPIEKLVKLYPHLKGLPIAPYANVTPRILIGVDNIHLGKPLRCVEGSFSEPIATKTRLGWTVFGPCCLPASVSSTAYFNLHLCVCNEEGNQNLDMALKRYFSLESIGVSAAQRLLPKEEERAITMLNTGTRLVGDRFETGLLWKYDDVRLPCNREMALKRHTCLKRKCEKNPELARAISNKMHEYADKGYIRRMSEDEIEARRERDWYLPIFPVYNPNKPGKLRMVFDAAAQVHGISLNMFLLTGPDQLVGLVQVLYKFRENRIAVTGDIREMFFQVRMNHADQRSQMVFWDDGSKQNGEPSVYAVTVMTFGAACSPASAHFVKNLNAERFVDRFPRAVECIKYEHYVDDMLASVETVDEAVTLAEDVRLVHSKGGFEIRNWLSNSKDVVHKLRWGVNQNKCVDMSSNQGTEKVLGMWWNTDDDMLTFRINPRMDEELLAGGRLPTRREVLSTLMMIYDPLGLIGHFLMFLKILLQDLWRTGIHWDKKVEGEAAKKWLRWTGLLPELEKLMIRRCYRSITSSPCVQLHVFTDASQSGMAAVAYLRFEESGVVECALVGSKTRVAPLKLLSIPRLELQAAVIGARFADHIAKAHRLRIDKRVFWTDSRNVVSWIKSDHRRYSPFVAFRVSELSEITDANEWRWLSTKVNVADDGTKWQGDPDLTSSSRWFRGPEFLWEVEENWPINKDDPGESSEELRKSLLHHAIVRNVVDFARFSRWKKLLRTVGFVHRYVGNLRRRARREKKDAGPLTQEELLAAERTLYIWAQLDGFAADIKRMKSGAKEKHPWKNLLKRDSVLYKLSPEIDERGILRMRGRLTNCTLLGDSLRKPVILPRRHPVTDLVIKDFHERYCHQSHRTVVGQLRTRYHIPKLLVEFNRVRRGCQHCKIRDAAPNPPLMGNIPRQRVAVNQRAFTYTGLDYFGPILVVVGRHSEKRWGALFTCLTTRAVHLELAFALTNASCILAIRRFIARRGSPREILSDRGTNFVGAARELNVALKDVDENALMSRFSGPELKWSFNPPAAPHFGGSWERLVQSVKKILCSFELPRLPTDEILMSTLTEVEMMINSRPLTYVPLDEESDSPITPNHLLLGSSDGSKPAACFDDSPTGIRTSLGALHVNAEIFWKRWIADYLPTLTRRTKWFDSVPPIKEGDVVLIVDGNLPRNTWPMGRVLEVTRARDGQVRRARVQTTNGILERPATKIAVLDVGERLSRK
ncbi:uncharacterized protein LOC128712627 [Anopheles marshallii]|uniref:uncharacterized protein LOC128712627 n=1 Tax=Anopheles marshallii TaxID=1521116 RepID=UPI00237B057C|nr:uncharacterized protein LOC128712627 [Anopheles marshallii]